MLGDRATFTSVVLRVRDLEAAAAWYELALGVEVSTGADGTHPFGAFTLGGSVISLWQLREDEPPPSGSVSEPYVVIVVRGELENLRAELAQRGVEVTPIGESELHRLFRLRDLDGNVIEVTQPRAGP